MPEALNISRSHDTPEVLLDPESGRFEFHYRSYPEDAIGFYNPILEWLSVYANNPNPNTLFNFNLEYFNTASAKQIYKILVMLQELNAKSRVEVHWLHHKEDADMQAAGERFSKLISGIDFQVISV